MMPINSRAASGKGVAVLLMLLVFSRNLLHGADEAENARNVRIHWQELPECSRYELTVQRQVENVWNTFLAKETADNSAELNLPQGKYRFSIRGYAAGGQAGADSAWSEFVVSEKSRAPPPVEAAAQQHFEADTAGPSFKLEALYLPLVVMPTGRFNMLFGETTFQPAGLGLRFSLLPFKFKNTRFGFELQPTWNYLAVSDRFRSRFTHIPALSLNAAGQIMLRRNIALNIRAGGGAAMYYTHYKYFLSDYIEPDESLDKITFVPAVTFGLSINTFITNVLYIDIGIDYFHSISSDDALLIYLRPFLGLGWYF
ncbi:MAG: hypothetical protein LBD20_04795 [Spirochaetaceae bacterium]|jgi:hypothetical protein|nr:hypothetical protein [Spirochaetaceae bacterium]